jgi:hypothetical protein
MSKMLEEMSLTEKSYWATGELIISIGEGRFRDRLVGIIMALEQAAFARGYEKGKKEVNDKRRVRRAKTNL